MLPSDSLVQRSPPSFDQFQLGFRAHSSSSTIRTLPFLPPGFTRWRKREVQIALDVLPHVIVETHVLLASPLVRVFNHRSRLSLSVDSAFRLWSASLASPTTWPTIPSADFCSTFKKNRSLSSRESTTCNRSP